MAASNNPWSSKYTSVDEYLYPMNVLDDELNFPDLQIRIHAIKNLSTIALALGVENTRLKLIPFLTMKIQNEYAEDLMVVLAEELGNFTDYIGGPAFVHTLLTPLEELAGFEGKVVRQKAVESLCKIATFHSPIDLENSFVHLIYRMVSFEWFTSRWSACGLFSAVYSRVCPMTKAKLCNNYRILCKDEAHIVRKAAAANLKEFVKVVDLDCLRKNLIPLFASLSKDEKESVRVSILEASISIFLFFSPTDVNELVMPLIRTLLLDDSLKIRFKVADILIELQKAVGPEITRVDLLPIFLRLLKDTQVDIRRTAVIRLCDFCHNLYTPEASDASSSDSNAAKISKEIDFIITTSILPIVEGLVKDANENVRMALSLVILKLSPILGKQRTLEHLFPLFCTLLSDECHEVCLNILVNLDSVSEVVGIEEFSKTFLPAVLQHFYHPVWRIRLAIIQYMPLLACQMSAHLFSECLKLCVSSLRNPVYAVREAGTLNLKKLIEIYGTDWAQEFVIPEVLLIAKDANYLYRMSFLFCISELAVVCGPEITAKTMLQTVLSMESDYVANVRFNVAKTLGKIGPAQSAEVKSQIKRILEKLSADNDLDVKDFSAKAISSIPWN